jgi:chromosome segregation ATPase
VDQILITIGALSPALTALIIKWLFKQYEKRGEELEKERQYKISKEMDTIEELIKRLSMDIDRLKDALNKNDKDLAILIEKLKFQVSDTERLMKAFNGFVETSGRRIESMESRVTEISKDVFLVSSKKKGDK